MDHSCSSSQHEKEVSDVAQAKCLDAPHRNSDGNGSQPMVSLEAISVELQRAHGETLSLREQLVQVQLHSADLHKNFSAEITRYKKEIVKLQAELAIADHDRRLNVTQMVNAMVAAERRLRGTGAVPAELEERYQNVLSYLERLKVAHQDLQRHAEDVAKQRDAFQQKLAKVQKKLKTVTNSFSWKVTAPLRHLVRNNPRAAQIGFRALRFAWHTLKLRSIYRVLKVDRWREVPLNPSGSKHPETGSQKPNHAESKRTMAPTSDPFLLPVGLLSRTGIQKGISIACVDPWPADRPLVSVVIPCFNYSHFVAEAVESVLAQTFRDLEIIVVEGGSSSLESRQQLAEMDFPRTRVLLQPEAHRAGANRNFGISQARGKYVCCLDADDRIDVTYIEKAVFLMEHYGYDVVSTAVEFFGNRTGGYGSLERPVLSDMLRANYIPTCAVFKREVWERVGGFRDSDLNTGHVHEDWLFWVRAGALGARFWNIVGERLFQYRIHGNSLSNGHDVLPIEHQRLAIHDLNADVLEAGVIERSSELAAQTWRHPEPLRNLARFGRDIADDRPSVLLALPFLIIGGAERLLSAIVAHLSAVGWRVIVVTTVQVGPEHGDTTDWFRTTTNEIYHLPRFLGQERWDDFISFLIQTKRIDLLWITGSAALYDRLPWLRALYPKLKVVDLLFNTVGHTANNRRHVDLIDLNLVENQEVYNWLVEQGEARDRIRKIESGLDLDRYTPRPKSHEVLNALGISEDTVLIGFSGRWSEEKDPLGFIEIAKLVPENVPVAFVMTGAGPLTKKVEAAVIEANFAANRFHLVGAVPDVTPYIASYDLLCLPSLLDGRPVVVLEALALGVPVLASRVGALPDLVQDMVNGRLCDPGDYPAFALRIAELVRSPSQLQKMKQQARLVAEQHLDACKMLAAYDDALRGTLASNAAGKLIESGEVTPRASSGEYRPENSSAE